MADMLSVSDALALQKTGEDNGMFGGNWVWIILLFFLFGFGGNGFGGNNSALTQAELQRGFDTSGIVNKLDNIGQGICTLGYENAQLTNGTQMAMMNGFNGVNSGIANLGYQMQDCCCQTNRNIDAVRYENAQNTCSITTAIHAEGEATRALIQANEVQALRDNLQAAQLQLGNVAQTQTILTNLGRYSPYGCGCCNPCC